MPSIWTSWNIQFPRIGVVQLEGVGRRIIAAIKQRVHDGSYRPGDGLPSSRAFAAEWGVSRTTVTAAYAQLVAEGYLIVRRGARPVVAAGLTAKPADGPTPPSAPPHLSAFANRLATLSPPAAAGGVTVADFRYGHVSAADFPVLAWRRAVTRASLRRRPVLQYGEPQGEAGLRAMLADYLWRARGIGCRSDDIVIVNGSQQGLDLAARILLDPGDGFLMENPGYGLARNVFLAAGGTAIPVPVDGDGLVTDVLPDARLAYVTPSHQFPLGGVLSATRRRALLAWASARGAYVIEDDYDAEYRHDIAPIPPVQTLDPQSVIYLGTVSKTLSPTLRLGYLVAPAALLPAFVEAKRITDRQTPLLEQEAWAELLASGAYERHVRAVRRRNGERRVTLLQALRRELGATFTLEGDRAGLHVVIWLDRMTAAREGELIASARAEGVGLYPVSPLYDPAGPLPQCAGLVMGYAGLDGDAITKGVAVMARLLANRHFLRGRPSGPSR